MKSSMRSALTLATAALLGCGHAFAAPKDKQTKNPAIVFMVAGQSNAGGCGVLSPETHKELGKDQERPLVPGSTAAEVGLPIRAEDYTHSYIWMKDTGFERLDPMTNTRPEKPRSKNHGIELPIAHHLEKQFPDHDIYFIKWGPNGKSLHTDWNPQKPNGIYAKWIGMVRQGLTQLAGEYPEVRVIGLYWDQGEGDQHQPDPYAENLTHFIATFRKDSGLPQLKVFLRKHMFGGMETIIAAQQAAAKQDPNVFLLDLDLGSPEKNFAAWGYSPNNAHLSSKAFVELTRRLFADVLKNPQVQSFDHYTNK